MEYSRSPTYMIYDYALVSYYITDASSGRISYQRRERNCSSVCPFVDFAFYQKRKRREREREIHVYTHTRIGSIREKTRFAPTLFDFERTTEIYALAIPSVCNKETKTRRQYMYRIRYRTPLGRQRERKKIMITIEL